MPRFSEEIASRRYLVLDNLSGQRWTIKSVEKVQIGREVDPSWVAYFVEDGRFLKLTDINCEQVVARYGDDTDGWVGQQVILEVVERTFRDRETGENVRRPCSFMRVPDAPKDHPAGELDDEIPF